ncbi:hypothetical protein GI582_05345 [Sulfitobacter sp. BDSS02]|uniref:hypothetical protein n=1 Tax=Heliomarina sp. TaxID=2917556 RepID=UPI00405A2C0C|nr:hypothetical protein [Sulfitobacter sp. BDSS02]MBR9848471.1 hypothetical protein [Paracoccaceae bacterium]
MRFELFQEPIVPASAAGFTTEELRRYLGVGKNSVALIAQRVGIENLHGIYPECIVWRQLFGLGAADEIALAALREPLADINWVSKATGVPQSTIRDHFRSGRWQYDRGVQLGDEDGAKPPRLRRWLPALIRNRTLGSPLPAFTRVASLTVTPGDPGEGPAFPPENADDPSSADVFTALFPDPTAISR